MNEYFRYGNEEIEYLKKKDKKLSKVIDYFGFIERPCNSDLYFSIVDAIISQQISAKAHHTIQQRLLDDLKEITPSTILSLSKEELQSYGLTFKKVDYIISFTHKVFNHEIDLKQLYTLEDQEIITLLSSLEGIGKWSAEMVMLHGMQRKNILSYGDLAIRKGIERVYHHKKLTKDLYSKYYKRFSPYGSVASIYFWKVSSLSDEEYSKLDQIIWKG